MNGIQLGAIYSDIASGISFDKRKDFFIMLDEIISGKICAILIAYKDRISRVGFDLFTHLFEQFGCKMRRSLIVRVRARKKPLQSGANSLLIEF